MDSVEEMAMSLSRYFLRVLGPVLCAGIYLILAVHVYAFFALICGLLKRRLGTTFGLIWISIGLALVYNIMYNHILAMMIKPGSTRDLKMIE